MLHPACTADLPLATAAPCGGEASHQLAHRNTADGHGSALSTARADIPLLCGWAQPNHLLDIPIHGTSNHAACFSLTRIVRLAHLPLPLLTVCVLLPHPSRCSHQARQKAEAVANQEDVPLKQKMREIEKLYAQVRSGTKRSAGPACCADGCSLVGSLCADRCRSPQHAARGTRQRSTAPVPQQLHPHTHTPLNHPPLPPGAGGQGQEEGRRLALRAVQGAEEGAAVRIMLLLRMPLLLLRVLPLLRMLCTPC